MLFTIQVTPVVIVWPLLDAVNVWVLPAGIAATAGLKRSPWAAETDKVAVPVKPPDELVAVTVTLAGLPGAVNKPEPLIDPPPLTAQVKVAPGWLGAKAANCAFPFTGTVATAGKMVTWLDAAALLEELLVELLGGLPTLTLLVLQPVKLITSKITISTLARFNRFGRNFKGKTPERSHGEENRGLKTFAIAVNPIPVSNPRDGFQDCTTIS